MALHTPWVVPLNLIPTKLLGKPNGMGPKERSAISFWEAAKSDVGRITQASAVVGCPCLGIYEKFAGAFPTRSETAGGTTEIACFRDQNRFAISLKGERSTKVGEYFLI
jgi:hypothetical protein